MPSEFVVPEMISKQLTLFATLSARQKPCLRPGLRPGRQLSGAGRPWCGPRKVVMCRSVICCWRQACWDVELSPSHEEAFILRSFGGRWSKWSKCIHWISLKSVAVSSTWCICFSVSGVSGPSRDPPGGCWYRRMGWPHDRAGHRGGRADHRASYRPQANQLIC